MSILEVKNLKKIYTTRFGGNKVEALKNVTFTAVSYTHLQSRSQTVGFSWAFPRKRSESRHSFLFD